MSETFTAYIVKDALAKGIYAINAVRLERGAICDAARLSEMYFDREWADNPERAVALANARRDRELVAARRKVARLEALTFEAPAE